MKNTTSINSRLYLPEYSCKDLLVCEKPDDAGIGVINNNKIEAVSVSEFSDVELLAAMSGIKVSQAADILKQYRLFELPAYIDSESIILTKRQKRAIMIALEFSKRVRHNTGEKYVYIKSPSDVVKELEEDYKKPDERDFYMYSSEYKKQTDEKGDSLHRMSKFFHRPPAGSVFKCRKT